MWKPFAFIYDTIREDFGFPVNLLRFVEEHPTIRVQLNEPKRVIAASSVVQWHEWGASHHERGQIMGWKYSAGAYNSFKVRRLELEHFGQCEITDNWECDIQDVTGLSASKSELTAFNSLDDMVETNSREMIDTITEDKLRKNLAHKEIRILHQDSSSDSFAHHLWDDRVFLINSGGSHHFAAARYIAARLGRTVPLRGKLRTYSINPQAVVALRHDFDMYAMRYAADIANDFHDAMRSFSATYLWHHLPRPYGHVRAIFLPKDEPRSARISSAFRDAGLLDLGEYLSVICEKQNTRKTQFTPHVTHRCQVSILLV